MADKAPGSTVRPMRPERADRREDGTTVGLTVADGPLGDLLRTDLERSGFSVVAVDPGAPPPEVVVTDHRGPSGRLLTVRLNGEVEHVSRDGEWWFPTSELDRLPEVLGVELQRARDGSRSA